MALRDKRIMHKVTRDVRLAGVRSELACAANEILELELWLMA